jgi:hypothetical protein
MAQGAPTRLDPVWAAVDPSAIVHAFTSRWTCGRSAAGSASPCQGEGRGFESRRPLERPFQGSYPVEWPRGEATACKAVYTGSNPVSTSVGDGTSKAPPRQHGTGRLAQGLARFPDTEEVTGSNPVSPTTTFSATLLATRRWRECARPLLLPDRSPADGCQTHAWHCRRRSTRWVVHILRISASQSRHVCCARNGPDVTCNRSSTLTPTT